MDFNLLNFLKSKKKTGLALGGGAVYGAAHVGVLKALEEHEIKIDFISGTSIGAFIASLYAFDIKTSEMEEMVKELSWNHVSSISLSKYALLSNDKFGKLVESKLGQSDIEDSSIPLAIVATDICTGEKMILKKGSVGNAVNASTCIPGLYHPVEWEGKMLVDGGIVENVPVQPLIDFGAEKIMAVDLNSGQSDLKPENIVDVLLNSFHFVFKSASKQITSKADVVINPDLSDYNRLDVSKVNDLVRIGYERTIEVLKETNQ